MASGLCYRWINRMAHKRLILSKGKCTKGFPMGKKKKLPWLPLRSVASKMPSKTRSVSLLTTLKEWWHRRCGSSISHPSGGRTTSRHSYILPVSAADTVPAEPVAQRAPWIKEGPKTWRILNLSCFIWDWVSFCWEHAVFWIPVTISGSDFANNYTEVTDYLSAGGQ